jgi:DNA-binding CsgD family transcriptional regulator
MVVESPLALPGWFVFQPLVSNAPDTITILLAILFVTAAVGLAGLVVAAWAVGHYTNNALVTGVARVVSVGLVALVFAAVQFQLVYGFAGAAQRWVQVIHGGLHAAQIATHVLVVYSGTLLLDLVGKQRWYHRALAAALWAAPAVAAVAFVASVPAGHRPMGDVMNVVLGLQLLAWSGAAVGVPAAAPVIPAVRRSFRRTATATVGFILAGWALEASARGLVLPVWVGAMLLIPIYVLTVVAIQLVGFYRGYPRRPLHHEGDVVKPGQQAFFETAVRDFGLTKRETAVLDLVLQGRTNQEIATRLAVSEKTVRNHISNVYAKTDARNRIDLINTFQLA